MESEDGLREIGEELPFLRAVDGGGEGIVEVEPLVGGRWFTQESVILERLLRVGRKAV